MSAFRDSHRYWLEGNLIGYLGLACEALGYGKESNPLAGANPMLHTLFSVGFLRTSRKSAKTLSGSPARD